MALTAGAIKGQSDENLASVFANSVSRYWFCLEIIYVKRNTVESTEAAEAVGVHLM